jgi:hypothetical protein
MTYSAALALQYGYDSYVNSHALTDEDILDSIDAFKNDLADRRGLGHSFAASGHLYPACFPLWASTYNNPLKPAPRGSAEFPSTVLMDGLRARNITPFLYWAPIASAIAITMVTAGTPAVITTSPAHGFLPGDILTVAGLAAPVSGLNGTQTVASIVDDSTFTTSAASASSAGTGHTVIGNVGWDIDHAQKSTWSAWSSGRFDDYLDRFASEANAWRKSGLNAKDLDCNPVKGDSMILIRMAQEHNGDWFPWSPGGYYTEPGHVHHNLGNTNATMKAGWQHIHDRWRIYNGADHLKLIYNPQAGGAYNATMDDAYPGDAYVQYNGFDLYATNPGGIHSIPGDPNSPLIWPVGTPLADLMPAALDRCLQYSGLPIIVGETGCGGGGDDDTGPDAVPSTTYPGTGLARSHWFTDHGGLASLVTA